MILSDDEAKTILSDQKKWPRRTKKWGVPAYRGYWLRACPSEARMAYLHSPGKASIRTYADGLYIYAHITDGFADVMAIEVCCNLQNFNDKRSRYTQSSGNSQITLPFEWLDSNMPIQKGRNKKVWDACGWFTQKPARDVVLTLRHKRVLFVLTDKDYSKFGTEHLPEAHEYFCRHRDLQQMNHQDMQSFIKGMALMNHFRVRP